MSDAMLVWSSMLGMSGVFWCMSGVFSGVVAAAPSRVCVCIAVMGLLLVQFWCCNIHTHETPNACEDSCPDTAVSKRRCCQHMLHVINS